MKMNNRAAELEKNFSRMFWIQALMSLKIMNVVVSIFYIHRSITLRQIFLLGVVFAVTNLILEIPSSYAADRWGRKKTIFVAVTLLAISSIFDFVSHSFGLFAVGIVLYAASYAFLSGTDDALIYDTTRELGRDKDSLKELGVYYSAQRVFKIIAPLVGVAIAHNLLEWQFQIIIAIEFLSTMMAVPFIFRLVEPRHTIDRGEAHIITDAWKLIRGNTEIMRMILSRTVIFITGFLVWRMHQEYLVSLGMSIWVLGFMWTIVNGVGYLGAKYLSRILPRVSSVNKINVLNIIFTAALIMFAVGSFFKYPRLLVAAFVILCIAEVARWPIFSDLFNKQSKSFNRATTLSLTNLFKSAIDIPLTLTAAWLVGFNPSYMFVFVAAIALGVIVFIPVRETVVVEGVA